MKIRPRVNDGIGQKIKMSYGIESLGCELRLITSTYSRSLGIDCPFITTGLQSCREATFGVKLILTSTEVRE